MRGNHYGKLGVACLSSEVKTLWYNRHIDPAPCEPVDTYWPSYTDPDILLMQDFVQKLVFITPLNDNEERAIMLCVIDTCTLREAGQEIGVTRERVRQILIKALRKFRTHHKELTGKYIFARDAGNIPWF